MKHAGDNTLDQLEATLVLLRKFAGPVERKRGVFYWKGRAFLHFHEDPEGVFADVRVDGAWRRIDITAPIKRRALIRLVRETLRSQE